MQVTIVKNEEGGNSVSTVVLRGSTDSILDDLERAVDDGVNTYKVTSEVIHFYNRLIVAYPRQSCQRCFCDYWIVIASFSISLLNVSSLLPPPQKRKYANLKFEV